MFHGHVALLLLKVLYSYKELQLKFPSPLLTDLKVFLSFFIAHKAL